MRLRFPHKALLGAWIFWAIGFFTSTYDRVLVLHAHGFTFKFDYICFVISALLIAFFELKNKFQRSRQALTHGFIVVCCLMATYYLFGASWSYFPLKSYAYSCWLLFDIFAVWLPFMVLAKYIDRAALFHLILITLTAIATVIIIDQIAFYWGYTEGLLGYNQGKMLHWGMSRPAAFAYEPSYIASFLALGFITIVPEIMKRTVADKALYFLMAWIVYALIATASRTGWFSLALGFVLLIAATFWQHRQIRWRPLVVSSLIVLLTCIVFILCTPTKNRDAMNENLISSVVTMKDGSGTARIKAMGGTTLAIAKDTHWLGIGLGASYKYWTEKNNINVLEEKEATEVRYGREVIMSTWGQILAEGGAFVFVSFGVAGLFLAYNLFLKWRKNDGSLELGALIAATLFFAFIAHWIGNVARTDMWVWYAVWSGLAYESHSKTNKID